jgi:N-acetylglucosamine-6-phosphate deacetylase
MGGANMECTLQGARLVDNMRDQQRADLVITGSRIRAVRNPGESASPSLHGKHTYIDATGMIVIPGFIDVHTHGGGGYNLHTADATGDTGFRPLGVKHRRHIVS